MMQKKCNSYFNISCLIWISPCPYFGKLTKFIIFMLMLFLTKPFFSGSDIAFYLHLAFSFLDVMYIPYAIIYYVDR